MQDRKKIVFFVTGLVGGAERVTVTIAKLLDRERFEVKLAVLDYEDCPLSMFIPKDIDIIYLNCHRLRDNSLGRMYKLLKNERPDYAFASITFVCMELLFICTYLLKGPKPIIRGQINPTAWKKHEIAAILAKWLYPKAYKVIAQTPLMRELMITEWKLKDGQCIQLYNPIDKKRIDEGIKDISPYTESNQYKYVATGRCQPQKGFDLLIIAMKKVVEYNQNSHLYIVGRKDESEYAILLDNLCKEYGLTNNVHFVGFQTNPYKFIYNADCFVLSSRDEGLPNVLIESTYLQKQAIAYKCIPVIKDIIQDGENGLCVNPEDIDGLSAAMIKIQSLDLNKPSRYRPASDGEFNRIFS